MKSKNSGCFIFIIVSIVVLISAYLIGRHKANESEYKFIKSSIYTDTTKTSSKLEQNTYSREDFIKIIEDRSDVKKVVFTTVGIVAIIINNNGSDYTQMARLYCRMAVEYGVGGVKGVKIIDSNGASYGDDWADGTVLAKEFIN